MPLICEGWCCQAFCENTDHEIVLQCLELIQIKLSLESAAADPSATTLLTIMNPLLFNLLVVGLGGPSSLI